MNKVWENDDKTMQIRFNTEGHWEIVRLGDSSTQLAKSYAATNSDDKSCPEERHFCWSENQVQVHQISFPIPM